jgi:hypothetical protein
MILQVPFEQFAPTVKRVLQHKEAFVTARGPATLATAASEDRTTMVVSLGSFNVADGRANLEKSGLEVFDGSWHTEGLFDTEVETATPFVAAVAYASQEAVPGLWVDAFETLPTHMAVLRALYDEFSETGQISEISFEEFVRLARPTVVIATPEDLHSYVSERRC